MADPAMVVPMVIMPMMVVSVRAVAMPFVTVSVVVMRMTRVRMPMGGMIVMRMILRHDRFHLWQLLSAGPAILQPPLLLPFATEILW
jgi:hypothetical protein